MRAERVGIVARDHIHIIGLTVNFLCAIPTPGDVGRRRQTVSLQIEHLVVVFIGNGDDLNVLGQIDLALEGVVGDLVVQVSSGVIGNGTQGLNGFVLVDLIIVEIEPYRLDIVALKRDLVDKGLAIVLTLSKQVVMRGLACHGRGAVDLIGILACGNGLCHGQRGQ